MAIGAPGLGVDLQPGIVAMAGAESRSGHGAGDCLRLRDHRYGGGGDPGKVFKALDLFRSDSVSEFHTNHKISYI